MGSGKSSILSALLRLIELSSGRILVDDMDLSTVPRQTIRGAITALPQEPVVLSGSIRTNIDPVGRYASDNEALTVALQRVQLWEAVRQRGGLDSEFTTSSFSLGQQQLLCLARCLLSNQGKILLLDEATSSIDRDTTEIIRDVLKNEFADCTVVEVLHRLDNIMDYDDVFVIQDGVPVEVGRPADLLSRTGSMLKELRDSVDRNTGYH